MEIRLNGPDTVTLEYGDSYSDPGAFALIRSSLIPDF